MGIVPIWGFQLMTAIALAFLFRLNKTLVILAANISIPPMIPIILYVSHITGSIWLGDRAISVAFDKSLSFDVMRESLLQYVAGALTLGIVSGVTFGLAAYAILKYFKRPVQS